MSNEVKTTRLPNGVRVVTSAMPHVQSVTLGIWIGVGARHEPGAQSGVSHFLEHLLFKGTKRRSSRAISQAIEGRGGYLNAFTQEESTCYYARVPFDHMRQAMDVLVDMFLNARFDRADIDKERGVIVEEIMMYRDQPQHRVYDLLAESLWKEHALGRPIIGTPETLGSLSRRDIVGYRDARYRGGSTVFALAGCIEHEACVELVSGFLGRLERGARLRATAVTPRVGQSRTAFEGREIEQTHVALGIRMFGRSDERRYALRLLNVVLGENMSSRLFQIVREKHGLAYSVSSSCQLHDETGALIVSAGLDKAQLVKTLGLISRELLRLKQDPIGGVELKRAREYVIGQLRLGLESTSNRMMWIGDHILSHGRVIPPEETIREVTRVTADDIRKLARAVLRPGHTSLAVVSPALDGTVRREAARAALAF
jgi:predicted Zn-dependent peptidase